MCASRVRCVGLALALDSRLSKMAEKRPSIEEIIDRRYDDLLRFVRYRIRDPAEVRDIAQEAFLRLLRRNREELIEKPEAYLFRIAANLAHEHRLRIKRHVDAGNDWVDETADRSRSPDVRAENQESIDRINEAFEMLPPLPRAALLLQRRDGLTYDEIAVRLGTTKHMVKKHLTRAMTQCRGALLEDNDE